jgi:hypothetical protein
VDGSFYGDVPRLDEVGNSIAASHYKVGFVQHVLITEAHALKNGIMLAQTVGCSRIIMSCECGRDYEDRCTDQARLAPDQRTILIYQQRTDPTP